MKRTSILICGAILFSERLCRPAAHLNVSLEQRLKHVDPTQKHDIALLALEIFRLHDCIKTGQCDVIGSDYKVYFPQDTEMRFSYRMRISIEKQLNNVRGELLLTFKRFPEWRTKENCFQHAYLYSDIERGKTGGFAPLLVSHAARKKFDLCAIIDELFNNELPSNSDRAADDDRRCLLM